MLRGPPLCLTPLNQVPEFLGAGARHWGFMLRGLRELEGALRGAGIAFFLLKVEGGRRVVGHDDGTDTPALVTFLAEW